MDRTAAIRRGAILCFATMRNEAVRLPHFLDHYRRLGVDHFLIVDNGSDDGTAEMLAEAPDVSLWRTESAYREARFGMDWLTLLQRRHGHGHWCLTVDADEILIYPEWERRGLGDLTAWLDREKIPAMGAVMLDLYPKGPLGAAPYAPGADPTEVLGWYDAWNYTWEWQPKYRNVSIRGGVRKRVFFADRPDHAPHLHKVPLVRWRRGYVYVSSTHIALPRRLNAVFDARLGRPYGTLLHTKFLDVVIEKSREEKRRRQHFTHVERYDRYYDEILRNPILWSKSSAQYKGWRELEDAGLMARGRWAGKARG